MTLPLTVMLVATVAGAAAAPARGSIRVTHPRLVAECLGTSAVPETVRSWRATGAPVSLTFTMRNEPRPGIASAPAGHATVTFTPVADHRYEIEVRAEATAFARRVWTEGAWRPVVRDRTTDTIVSDAPTWGAVPCAPASRER